MSIDDFRRDPASLYKLAVEQATDFAIFLLDADAKVASWAPPVARMLGWTADEFVGAPFQLLFAPDDIAAGLPEDAVARATTQGHARYTRRQQRRDGSSIWGHARIARIDDGSGLVGFVVSLQDVTAAQEEEARHLAVEASLRNRAAELQTLLEVVPIGIGIARDADASHVQVNKAFADMLRMSSDANASLSAPVGERPSHFRVLRDDRELSADELPLQVAARTGRSITDFEVDVVFESGDRVRLLEHASPLLDEQGVSRGSVGAFIDVTERKNYAEQRERMLAAEREARQEAERVNVIKDEFLAGLSHEIRTPLNAILGWAHILRHNPGMPAEAQAGLEVIERNARLQTHLIEDLLDLSRIVSGKLHMDVQSVTLASVVDAAIESIQPMVTAKGVQLVAASDHNHDVVAGDPVRLQQVVWNLLANAVKFTPRGGQISIGLLRIREHLELTVADSGIGISADFLPHVFDRFRQADGSTTRNFGGLGVGLSIVKQLVESHGGSVRATSQGEHHGATFIVSLPVMIVEDGPAQRPDAGGDAHQELTSLRDLSVLIVEDDEDSRMLLGAMLRRAGAAVRPVASASAALLELQRHVPDVIVSDIGLPDQDGYGLIRAIRALPAPVGQIPAMALTAYARPEDRRLALLAGFELHLAKPVDSDALCNAVASLAVKRQQPPAS